MGPTPGVAAAAVVGLLAFAGGCGQAEPDPVEPYYGPWEVDTGSLAEAVRAAYTASIAEQAGQDDSEEAFSVGLAEGLAAAVAEAAIDQLVAQFEGITLTIEPGGTFTLRAPNASDLELETAGGMWVYDSGRLRLTATEPDTGQARTGVAALDSAGVLTVDFSESAAATSTAAAQAGESGGEAGIAGDGPPGSPGSGTPADAGEALERLVFRRPVS